MTEPELLEISNEIYTYAALLLKFFSQSLEERLQSAGVTISGLQFSLLRMLQFETLTSRQLSQRMGLDPSSVMRMIDALESKELVLRGVDPHDRRRTPLQITQKGLELLAAVPVISEKDTIYQALQTLGQEPALKLRELLLSVIRQVPEGRLVTDLISGKPGPEVEPKDG